MIKKKKQYIRYRERLKKYSEYGTLLEGKCPFCGEDNTHVIDSRKVDDNTAIRRRRICDSCRKRFTSYEKVERIPLMVVKKDLTREPYDRSKIEGGIVRACHKRAVSAQQ